MAIRHCRSGSPTPGVEGGVSRESIRFYRVELTSAELLPLALPVLQGRVDQGLGRRLVFRVFVLKYLFVLGSLELAR
jgi:hypothetical protein